MQGQSRQGCWAEKNDPALPPAEASAIQAVIPSDIFNWQGPTKYLVPSSERIWSEQKWYALTDRVVGRVSLSRPIWQKIEGHSTAGHHSGRQGVFRHRPRSRRSLKPENRSSRVRGVGDPN